MKTVCVFCGSSPGSRSSYIEAARELGTYLARRELTLVYGGARVGMMGQLARVLVEAGGEVIGVIPKQLVELEVAETTLTDLRVVESMAERKALMIELSDAFVALPGGFGTIDELFEVLTWAQLGLHRKPVGLLNVDGYYDSLAGFLDHAVAQHFVEPEHREMILLEKSPHVLLDRFLAYQPPKISKAEMALRKLRSLE